MEITGHSCLGHEKNQIRNLNRSNWKLAALAYRSRKKRHSEYPDIYLIKFLDNLRISM
jgi:hypothetical protein